MSLPSGIGTPAIQDVAAEIASQVPLEDWAKVPPDLSTTFRERRARAAMIRQAVCDYPAAAKLAVERECG
jgi:hypothetical protein